MDPITHTMSGAVLARSGGDTKTPLAAATLMLAANAPDIDIYTVWTESSFGSIAFRRGWTHGPIFLALLPIIITAIVVAWDRGIRRRRNPALAPVDVQWTFILAIIGTLSHPALDWLNTYGIRFLMPFSGTWFAGDSVFIIDPYWWMLLGLTLWLARRGKSLVVVRRAAMVALAYPLLMIGLSTLGDRIALSDAAEDIEDVSEVMYQPTPANPLVADLIAVTPTAYYFGSLSWLRGGRAVFDNKPIAKGPWSDARVTRAIAADQDVRDFLVWARYAWVRIDTTATGAPVAVVFGDARFPEGGLAGGLGGLRVPITP